MTRARLAQWAAAALVLLAIACLARRAEAQILSPGPLSKAHTQLEGDVHCSECHSSGKRVDQGACLKCHSDLGARINAGQGLHGLQYKGKPCESCHVEHLGVGASTVRWPGGDPSKLDHAQTGWPLEGAHRAPCTKCHDKRNARGNATYLNLSTTCTSCHKDQHEGRFGATCTSCHDTTAWSALRLPTFDHGLARFPLKGAHATVPCAKCHGEPPKYVGLKFAACNDCHKDPHAGRLGTTCTDCHDETKWKPVSSFTAGMRHPGVSLANGHAGVACRACHDRGNLVAPSKGSECASCHRPVHEAPFGRGCAQCHGSIQWLGLPRNVGLTAHGRTAYPLDGKHADVACARCHKPEQPEDARFRKLAFDRCIDCHRDEHRGEFAARNGGECKGCHATSGFRPTLFDANAHASTKLPLEGKHVAAPCTSCHTSARPHLDLRVTKQACADCHANPHGSQFAAEMAKGGCAQCHDPRGWDLPRIDHSTWPLTGAHALTLCDGCHHPTAEDRKAGHGASYRGVPRNCAGCHDDAHLGQFRLSPPALECDSCHDTASFRMPRFDHAAKTKWPLTGAHERTPCAKCHPTTTPAGATQAVVRWRGLGTDCKFCHANPHVAPASKATTASAFGDAVPCDACHATSAWKATNASGGAARFDHATTGFPLTGGHVSAPCVACHKSAQPPKRACASCHEDTHRGRLLQTCDACHVPAGWRVTRPLDVHKRTRFPLTGMHTLADCTQCHLRASENRFTDAPVDCYGCHQQDYRRPGIFPVHVGSATAAPLPRDCSTCHRATAWVPASVPAPLLASLGSPLTTQPAPRSHDVRFPIGFGAHRTATCDDCHASTAAPRNVRCVGCHAHDPVLVLQRHKQPIAMDGASCVSCHPGGARR